MIELSIVIPCYNEAKNIPLIIDKLQSSISDNLKQNIEVLLVNNGSSDNTKKILEKELAKKINSFIKKVDVEVNQGYGFGILSGLKKASGQVLAWTHADMQTDPADVIKAFELFKEKQNQNIFIKGKRKNRKLFEAFFTFGMQIIALFVLKTYLDDINAQPKLFSKKFFEKHLKKEAPSDFSLDLYALFQAKKYCTSVLEIPVYFNKRIYGEAKGGGSWKTRIKLIKRTLNYIFKLKKTLSKKY